MNTRLTLLLPFAGAAKLTTAWFLIERARLVTSPLVPRLKNKLYLFNFGLSTLWFAALVLMLVFRESTIRAPDGECLISMGSGPAGAMIGIDAFLNIYYTSLFALPLFRGKWKNPKLKQLAVKSALAAVLTVSSSVANLGLLAAHHGTELSWVCLSTCTLDTVWCAVVLCALTGRHDDDQASDVAPTQRDIHTSFLWRRTADAGPSAVAGTGAGNGGRKSSSQGSNLSPFSHGSAPHSNGVGLDSATAGWGTFGRIELGEGNVLGGGAGAGVVVGAGRRGSAAPEEMCLGAVNERKVVDGAWKAASPKEEELELQEEEEGSGGEVSEVEGPRVGFAVLATDYQLGAGLREAERES